MRQRAELAQLADQLAPYLLPLVTAQSAASSGTSGGSSVAPHALDSSIHTGTLSWSKVNKSGSAFGDLQNRAHTLATNAGLGPDHTVSGLTAGHVLRASGASAAAFAACSLIAWDGRRWAPWWVTVATVVGVSRAYVRIHHASDVVGGAITGALLAAIARPVLRRFR